MSSVVDRPAVLLDGADALILMNLLVPLLTRHGVVLSSAQREALGPVFQAAKAFTVAAGSAAVSALGPDDSVAVGSWLSAGGAAARLGISPRAVRAAARRGDLVSRQIGRGPHEIEESSVERYAQRRRSRSAA